MNPLAITYWSSLLSPRGQRILTTWEKLAERLAKPRIQEIKSKIPGFALATFRDDYRKLENVERVFAVTLDLDALAAVSVDVAREPGELVEALDLEDVRSRFGTYDALIYTTWKSTTYEPRARLILRLSRPVSGDEYRRVYRAVTRNAERAGLVVDRQASDPSRLWYLPAIADEGRTFTYSRSEGRPVDVDRALAFEPAPAPPAPPPRGPLPEAVTGDAYEHTLARAEKYLETCDPAVSGSGGHSRTFVVAQKLVLGFELDEETAYRLLCSWNQRCVPPWSAHDLRRKVQQAVQRGTMAKGAIRDRERSR